MAQYPGLPTRRLTPDEAIRSGERLSRPKSSQKTVPLDAREKDKKVLKQDELEAFLERAYTRQVQRMRSARQADAKDLEEGLRKANGDVRPCSHRGPGDDFTPQEKNIIQRMYEGPKRHKEVAMQALEQKYYLPAIQRKSMTMTPEEADESADRLFRRSSQHRKAILEAAEIKIYGKAEPTKPLSRQQLEECVDHLYTQSLKHRAEVLAKIEEDNPPERGAVVKLSPEELAATAERLYTKR